MEGEARDYEEYPRLEPDQETVSGEPEVGDTGAASEAEPSPAAKADIGKRAVAAIIDAVVGVVVAFIPVVGGLVAAAYWLVRDGLDIEFMDKRSLGKKLVKLRPVRDDGGEMDIETSIKRNWMFALGGLTSVLLFIPIIGWLLIPIVGLLALGIAIVEIVLVITDAEGRRFGDKFAGTKVIEVDS